MEAVAVRENMGIHFSFFQCPLFACLQSNNNENGSLHKYDMERVFCLFVFKDSGQVINLLWKATMRMNPVKSSSKYDKRNV